MSLLVYMYVYVPIASARLLKKYLPTEPVPASIIMPNPKPETHTTYLYRSRYTDLIIFYPYVMNGLYNLYHLDESKHQELFSSYSFFFDGGF